MGAKVLKKQTVQMSSSTIQAKDTHKTSVQDIRFKKHLVGPIEELENMSLIEFRRLSSDPQEAVEKIKNKINLLEEQGYDQKLLAVQAWQNSLVNQEYLKLSSQALFSGKSLKDLLDDGDQGHLTETEVLAILELNGELNF